MPDLPTPQHAFTVDAGAAGERLDKIVAARIDSLSRAAVQRLISEGQVRLDGATPRPSDKVREGQRVEVEIPPPRPTELVPEAMDLDILYEDAHLLIIEKPAGLVVHPAPSVQEATLVHGLLALDSEFTGIGGEDRPGIVHRLDKGTSGIMVVAKDDPTHRGLVDLFKVHDIERRYLALVRGALRDLQGTWTSELGRNPRNRLKMASVQRGGRRAITHYRTLARYPGASLLELTLETGRTHQIRVHASEAGHAVLGDPTYSPRQSRGLPEDEALAAALEAVDHQLLHAAVLGFVHPLTGEALRFERPPPPDFIRVQRCLERLAAEARP